MGIKDLEAPESQVVEDVATEELGEVKTYWKPFIAICAVCFIFFVQVLSVLGSGFLATPTATLLGDPRKSVWFSAILTIFTLALVPPVSQAADYWGRKYLILFTSLGGIVGPIVVSRAQDLTTAFAGFSLIGISFGCQSLCYAIPAEILPRKYRSISQAALNMSSSAGAVVGVLMGGALLRNNHAENYRIFWYVAAGIYAVGCLGVLVGYNPAPRNLQSSLTQFEKLCRLDWIGFILIAAGLSLFSIGLQWNGDPYTWKEAPVLAPFIIGVLLLISFGIYEWRGRRDGLLHHDLFGNRSFPLAIVVVFIEGSAFFTANSYFIYELTVLYRLDTFAAGLRFIILFLTSTVLGFVIGGYTTWTKRFREPLVVGLALLLAFNVAMANLKESTPAANVWGYAVIGGSGLGLLLTNIMVAAQMSTPADMISVTSGLMIATRSLGATVGLAVNNAIFNNTLSSEIPAKIAAAVLPLGFPKAELADLINAMTSGNQKAIEQLSGVSAEIIAAATSALTDAYTVAFRNAWIAASCLSAAGLISVCLIRNNKSEFNHHIDAAMDARAVNHED